MIFYDKKNEKNVKKKLKVAIEYYFASHSYFITTDGEYGGYGGYG